MITMLIDHFAGYMQTPLNISEENYLACRTIGRLAFPLFAFLLVESFFYTKDKKKHIGRMFILAVISEIPANLVFGNSIIYISFQNTIFELSIGFVLLCFFEWICKTEINSNLKKFLCFIVTATYCVLTELLHLDYGLSGILLIAMFYIAKKQKEQRAKYTILAITIYIIANLLKGASFFYLFVYTDVVLIKCAIDNKCYCERKITKAETLACRWFYPAHLILLIITKWIILNY